MHQQVTETKKATVISEHFVLLTHDAVAVQFKVEWFQPFACFTFVHSSDITFGPL